MEEREAFREFYLKYAKKLYRVVERLQEIQEGKVGDYYGRCCAGKLPAGIC